MDDDGWRGALNRLQSVIKPPIFAVVRKTFDTAAEPATHRFSFSPISLSNCRSLAVVFWGRESSEGSSRNAKRLRPMTNQLNLIPGKYIFASEK